VACHSPGVGCPGTSGYPQSCPLASPFHTHHRLCHCPEMGRLWSINNPLLTALRVECLLQEPSQRLATLEAAGQAGVPMTTGENHPPVYLHVGWSGTGAAAG
jgi:hypothetical protein